MAACEVPLIQHSAASNFAASSSCCSPLYSYAYSYVYHIPPVVFLPATSPLPALASAAARMPPLWPVCIYCSKPYCLIEISAKANRSTESCSLEYWSMAMATQPQGMRWQPRQRSVRFVWHAWGACSSFSLCAGASHCLLAATLWFRVSLKRGRRRVGCRRGERARLLLEWGCSLCWQLKGLVEE